jgi:hypothetical protein
MTTFRELERRNVRDFWPNEARDFTPWLAEEIGQEDTSHLEDTLGLDIKVTETERSVGRYNVDILAKATDDNRTIVIENQLASSDHDHLGKSIAYAAGVDADVIVWIAPQFHDEHADAAQWLNKNSREGIDFFALQLEVVTIGDSAPAVRFTPSAEPSEWTERINRSQSELTDTQQIYEQFWTEFRDLLESQPTPFSTRKPLPRHHYSNSIGVSGFHMNFVASKQSPKLECVLTIEDDAEAFETLYAQKDEIEAELGTSVEWDEPEITSAGKERSQLRVTREGDIFVAEDRDEVWTEYQEWFLEIGERFYETLEPRVQRLQDL